MGSLYHGAAELTNPGAILPSAFLIISLFVQPSSITGVEMFCYRGYECSMQHNHNVNEFLQTAEYYMS